MSATRPGPLVGMDQAWVVNGEVGRSGPVASIDLLDGSAVSRIGEDRRVVFPRERGGGGGEIGLLAGCQVKGPQFPCFEEYVPGAVAKFLAGVGKPWAVGGQLGILGLKRDVADGRLGGEDE